MATVDPLDIQIQGSAQKASVAIDSLVKKLDRLSASLSGVNSRGLATLGAGVNKLSNAMSNFSGNTRTGDFAKLSKSLEAISKIDSSKLAATSSQISQLSTAFSNVGTIDTRGITDIASSISKLGGKNANAGADNLIKIGDKLSKFVAEMNALGSVTFDSSSLSDLIGNISRLGGKNAAEAVKNLPEISAQLQKFVTELNNIGGLNFDTSNLANLVSNISKLGGKPASNAAANIPQIAAELNNLMATLSRAPKVSRNVIDMTQAIAQLSSSGGKVSSVSVKMSSAIKPANAAISGLSKTATVASNSVKSAFSGIAKAASTAGKIIRNSMKGLINVLSGTFSKIGQIGLKAASSMKKVAGDMAAAFSKITHSSKGLKTTSSNLGTLFKTIIGFKGIQGLLNFGKSALDLGSNITEVENVVDTAFGNMRQHAYDFASTATEQFGLSELAAKQYSGTMMAMLKSSGVAQPAAAKMATTIAGLAGDIASFYNIDTDEAFYKLRSAISGETEPMKALGVNMNIVNLEAFAMSRGINKAYRDMTLAEQATLRYEYILAKTTDAQGDFAKTSDTFANQWRLLKLNIESVSAVLGQGLIAGILPVIKALNMLMGKLMQAATAFRNFMYSLMGKKLKGSTGGIVNDLTGIETDMGGIGDAAEEAGKKIKDKLLLLPFDELNVLTEASDKLNDSVGGIDTGLDMGGFDDFDSLEDVDITPINEFAERIRQAFLDHDWEGVGKEIGNLLNAGMQKLYDVINWDNLGERITGFTSAFSTAFNSLVDSINWDLLGRTVGAGINTLANTFNQLLEKINFENIGRKLSDALRGTLDEVDWKNLGNLIGNYFMVAWRVAEGFIEGMWRIDPKTLLSGWAELGIAIGDAINGIFERIDFARISKAIADGIKGILEAATYALNTIRFDEIAENINRGLQSLYDGMSWDAIGEKITAFTAAVSKAFNDLLDLDFGLVGKTIGAGIADIVRAFNQLTGEGGINFELLGVKISEGLRGSFEKIPWQEFGNALGNGFMVAWRMLDGFVVEMSRKNDAGLTGWQQLGISIAQAVYGMFEKIDLGRIGTILADIFNGIFETLKSVVDEMESGGKWKQIADNISRGLNNAISGIKPIEAAQALGRFVTDLLQTMLDVAQNTPWQELGQKIGQFLANIPWGEILRNVFDIITTVLVGLFIGLITEIASHFGDVGNALADGFNHAFERLREFTASVPWESISVNIYTGLNNMIHGIDWASAGKTLSDFVMKLLGVFREVAENTDWEGFGRGIGEFLSNIDWLGILKSVFDIIWNVLTGLIDGLQETTVGKILLVLAAIAAAIKGFDIALSIAEFVNRAKIAFGFLPKEVESVVPVVVEKLKGIGTGIMEKVVPLISTGIGKIVGEGGLFSKLAVGASGLVAKIGPVLSSIGSVIFSPQGALIAGIIAGVILIIANWDKIKEAAGKVKDWVVEKWEAVKEKTSEIWGNVTDFLSDAWNGIKETASNIWGGISDFFHAMWDAVTVAFTTAWEGITGFLSDVWSGISETAENIWGGIKDFFGGLWDGIKSTAETAWNGISDFLGGVWDGVKTTAETVWNGIGTFLSDTWDSIKGWASDKFAAIGETISGAWDGVKETAKSVWDNVSTFLGDTWDKLKAGAKDKFDTIKKHVSDAWDAVKTKTSDIWGGIKTSLGNLWDNLKTGAKDKFDTIKKNISDAWDTAKKTTSETWENVKKTVGDRLSETAKDTSEKFAKLQGEMGEHGKNVVSGLAKGITDKESELRGVTEKTASNVTGWFKDKLGIHSPSTVFEGIGENTMQGYANGISSAKSTVTDKINSIVKGTTEPFSGMDKQFNKMGTELITGLSGGIKSAFSMVTDGTKTIAQSMKTIFEGLDFTKIGTGMMDKLVNGIKGAGSLLKNVASSIASTFSDTVGNTISGVLNKVNNAFSNVKTKTTSYSTGKTTKSVPRYAVGGFPEDGLFFANHNELVGEFSNGQTAVANNAQIVDGIKYGVREAVAEVLAPYLADIAQNTRETANKNMTVRIGDRDIKSAYDRATSRQGYPLNTSYSTP